MERTKNDKFQFHNIVKNQKQMLQFFLLKFLKLEDLINLKLISKKCGLMCDTNYFYTNPNKESKISTIKITKTIKKMEKQTKQEDIRLQRFLMVMIALQHYSQLIQDGKEDKTKILQKIEEIEQNGIKENEFTLLLNTEPIYTIYQFNFYICGSKIINSVQQQQITQKIINQDPKVQKIICLLRLNENQLKEGNNLRQYQLRLFDLFRNQYNGFLIIIKTNYNKNIAYYIPRQFQQTEGMMPTGKYQAYYWINNDQLVAVTRQKNNWFDSYDYYLINIDGMYIKNNRNEQDWAYFDIRYWQGILIGNDGYPKKHKEYGYYCITGGQNRYFKAVAIEFYGVKTKQQNLNEQQIQEERKIIINQYLVLSQIQLNNIKTEIKKLNNNIYQIDLVFQQNIEKKQNLDEIRNQLYIIMKTYQGFIIATKTNYGRNIAFYIPMQFQEIRWTRWKNQEQLGFYWINEDQLVTVTRSNENQFHSDDEYLIDIREMNIKNNRNKQDYAYLHSGYCYWQGILVGNDGYPKKHKKENWYCIGGGEDGFFKATAIEFYGVNW